MLLFLPRQVGVCACVYVCLTQSSPCQSHNHSWWSDTVHSIHCENRFTHVVLQVGRCNSHGGLVTTDNTECHLTENLTEGKGN